MLNVKSPLTIEKMCQSHLPTYVTVHTNQLLGEAEKERSDRSGCHGGHGGGQRGTAVAALTLAAVVIVLTVQLMPRI